MSFRIQDDGTMYLTRGDTAKFTIMPSRDGEVYELQDGDTVRFTVKKSTSDDTAIISKSGLEIEILPKETAGLTYGEYKYDVEMTFADGEVETFIGPNDFVILEEVTF